jgi:ABC-type nitrate/sulfonate/bicarbonate transport system substrate-binding protein
VDDASFWACNKKLPITVGADGICRHSPLQRILKRTQLLPFLFMTQLLPLRLVYSAKSLRSALLGFVAIAGVSGWLAGMGPSYALAADRDQKKPNQIQTKELHIGLQKSSTFNVVRARGDLEKWLNRQGITVTWSEFTSGPPLLEALAAGKVDVGETGDAPVIFAQAKNAPVVYFGQSQPNPEAVALLVPQGSPIRTLADLKGKKVALPGAPAPSPWLSMRLPKVV